MLSPTSFFLTSSLLIPFLAQSTNAQAGLEAFQVYNTTGRLPDGCIDGYTAGHDEFLYNVPYSYDQVLAVIGSFANITWNGINETRLNGTDNTVGTARFYTSFGISLIETIKTYQSPAGGPYYEDHTLAPAYNPTADLSIYAPIDITTATSICSNTATALNFTIDFCSTNVSAATGILHDSHVFDATTLQEFLGNDTWTGCATSTSPTNGTGSTSNSTTNGNTTTHASGGALSPTMTPATFTGGAEVLVSGFGAIITGLSVAFLL